VCYEWHIFEYGTMVWVLSHRTNTILSADSKRSRMDNNTVTKGNLKRCRSLFEYPNAIYH